MFLENGADLQQKIRLKERFVHTAVRPDAQEAGAVTVPKPIRNLLDGGLFEVVGERGLAGVGRIAGENVSSRVRHARERG
jgi:hypothetical protein